MGKYKTFLPWDNWFLWLDWKRHIDLIIVYLHHISLHFLFNLIIISSFHHHHQTQVKTHIIMLLWNPKQKQKIENTILLSSQTQKLYNLKHIILVIVLNQTSFNPVLKSIHLQPIFLNPISFNLFYGSFGSLLLLTLWVFREIWYKAMGFF
jgi:hypothetical protein